MNDSEAEIIVAGLSRIGEALKELTRPRYCCGVCPGIEGGGYDCTCRWNKNCPKSLKFKLLKLIGKR